MGAMPAVQVHGMLAVFVSACEEAAALPAEKRAVKGRGTVGRKSSLAPLEQVHQPVAPTPPPPSPASITVLSAFFWAKTAPINALVDKLFGFSRN